MVLSLSREQLVDSIRLLRRRIVGMTGRPVSIVLSRWEQTASTDCLRVVNFNPRPFEQGLIDVGIGIGTHEAGHICFSPWGAEAMKRAHAEGGEQGEELAVIVNLLLDRKDDYLSRRTFPGASRELNARMPYITPRPWDFKERRTEAFTDFFFVCKGFARPRHPAVWRCLKVMRRRLRNFSQMTLEVLLECAKELFEILEEASPEGLKGHLQARRMVKLYRDMAEKEEGEPELTEEERELIAQVIAQVEAEEERERFPWHSDENTPIPPPGEVGRKDGEIEELDVPPELAKFQVVYDEIAHLVDPLRARLEQVAPPIAIVHRGLEEGELDDLQLAQLAIGRPDIMKREEILRRDVTVALCLDASGSMGFSVSPGSSSKMHYASQLGVLFNAALESLPNVTTGTWAFDDVLSNCGPASLQSGISNVRASGGNSDSHMLNRLVRYFSEFSAERMVAFIVSDGGPDSFEAIEEQVRILRKMGVLTVQFFIEAEVEEGSEQAAGLKASIKRLRGIYDHQIIFDSESIDSMVEELGFLLRQLFEQ